MMANELLKAYSGAGMAQGFNAITQDIAAKPERDARRAEAVASRELAQLKLNEYKDTAPQRKSAAELQLEQQSQQLRSLQADALKTNTFSYLRQYTSDGDVKHLNNFLQTAKKNPLGARTYGEVSRFDKLTPSASTDALLKEAGFADPSLVYDDPDVADNFVLVTRPDGTQILSDMNKFMAGTGFTNMLDAEKLDSLSKKAAYAKLLQGAESSDTNMIDKIMKEEGLTRLEAAKKWFELKNAGKPGGGSTIEREIDRVLQDNPEMSREEAALEAKRRIEPRTAGAKDIEGAAATREAIDKAAGGDFFDADLNDPTVRRKIGPHIAALEKQLGVKMTTDDRRTARNIRSLMALGKEAGEGISDAETGLIDSMFDKVRKYVSDEVTGTQGVAAYETFRNTLRNALYGASLTNNETASFNKAAGTLGQKTGPVLAQLRTQISEVKNQLSSIYDMNEEYVAQYYLGRSREEIDQTIAALDERLSAFKDVGEKSTSKEPAAVPLKKVPKQPLSEIFSGAL